MPSSSQTTVLPAFSGQGNFYRGSLHCHSTLSDGALEPEGVIEAYRSAGYDFICLSDHFEEEYGWSVSDTSSFRDDTFTTLIGAELSRPGRNADKWWLLACGLPLDFAPVGANETGPDLAARAQSEGAFIALLHPGYNATHYYDVERLVAIDAVEIYNHAVSRAHDRGEGWYLCEDFLDAGRELAVIASDDAHFTSGGYDTLGGGWIELHSRSLDPGSLMESLRKGAFYSTMGPRFYNIAVTERIVEVQCSPAEVVTLTGPGSLVSDVAFRTWTGDVADSQLRGTVTSALPDGITGCSLPLDLADGDGWQPGDWWRVTILAADGRRAWSNPSRVGV